MAQEKTDKMREPLEDGLVRPIEDVVVYTTKALKSIFPTIGTPVTLHRVQAEKWIEDGKATKSADKDAPVSGKKGAEKGSSTDEDSL